MSKLQIRKVVKLNYTAEDWQLYTMSNPTATKSLAFLLNDTFESEVNQGRSIKEVEEAMHELMAEYSDLGADDTEPRQVRSRLLEKVYQA